MISFFNARYPTDSLRGPVQTLRRGAERRVFNNSQYFWSISYCELCGSFQLFRPYHREFSRLFCLESVFFWVNFVLYYRILYNIFEIINCFLVGIMLLFRVYSDYCFTIVVWVFYTYSTYQNVLLRFILVVFSRL